MVHSKIPAVLVLLCLSCSTANAATMKRAMGDVATALANFLENEGANGVRVDPPSGPPLDSATRGMQLLLVDKLKERGVKINKVLPNFVLVTEYERSSGSNRYSMTIRVKDRAGSSIGSFSQNFQRAVQFVPGNENEKLVVEPSPAERAVAEGKTLDVTNNGTEMPVPATTDRLVAAIDAAPSVVVEPRFEASTPDAPKTVVSPSKGSLFRIEILAKDEDSIGDYEPRPVEESEGYALCELEGGDVYAVRIVNDADHAVAVALSIDGINMWHNSSNPAWREHGKFVVAANSSATMRGWHFGEKGPSDYREFKVVELPHGVVADIGADQTAVGQVNALFFAAWKPGEAKPVVEPIAKKGPGDATGIGKPVEQKTTSSSYFVGDSLLASVTIRYARPEPSDLP